MVNLFLSPLQGEWKALPPLEARQQRPLWREGSRKRMQIGAGGRGQLQPRGQESGHMGCSLSSLLWSSSRSLAPLDGARRPPSRVSFRLCILQPVRQPSSQGLLVAPWAREEGRAWMQVKGILLPVCPGPPDRGRKAPSPRMAGMVEGTRPNDLN